MEGIWDEYKRYFTNKAGEVKPLKGRNDYIKNKFLRPMLEKWADRRMLDVEMEDAQTRTLLDTLEFSKTPDDPASYTYPNERMDDEISRRGLGGWRR
jgi:hypothetical protein